MEQRVLVVPDAEAVGILGANELIAALARDDADDECTPPRSCVLSGGTTPAFLYRRLTVPDGESACASKGEGLSKMGVHLFWGDERCVPPGHERSNYKLANDLLLAPLQWPGERIHRFRGETEDPEAEADRYEAELRTFLNNGERMFDAIVLGVGVDGHTASLFPGAPALTETDRWVTVAYHPETGEPRLTMTLSCLNRARACIFLVAGESKAEAVRHILEPEGGPSDLPAARIAPAGGVRTWILDESAARRLS